MKLLLDQGLPRSTVLQLQNHGVDAVHVGDKSLATATDSKILDVGRQEGMAVVTLDADFHALLALSGVTGPSVIRIRIEGLRGEELARLLVSVLQICDDDLLKGAMVSVTENGVRIRRLPVFR
jgi:predicted nuclease of predicted toxin-antitoxin system